MKLSTGRLLLMAAASAMFSGCASIGPPQPPSLALPRPPSDLRATRKGDRVLLAWTIPTLTTDRQTVRSLGVTRICRGLEPVLSSCDSPAGEAAPPQSPGAVRKAGGQKVAASYSDTLPSQLERDNPLGSATYAVEVLNADGRGAGLSNQVHVPLPPALSPPQDFVAHVTAEGAVLTWTGAPPAASEPSTHYIYRIYRRLEGGEQEILAGEVPAAASPTYTFTDPAIEWEKTYYYRANTVTVVEQKDQPTVRVEGDDAPEVKLFAHDIFPPAVPSGLQAVFSGPGQEPFIDLVWAPVSDVDLAGYDVYRREAGGSPEKTNSELVRTPAYRDTKVASGKEYFYSVSAVDIRGNESARSEEASEKVP